LAEAEVKAPVPGSPEHDAAMAAKVDENAQAALNAATGESLEAAPEAAPQESAKEEQAAPKEGEQKPAQGTDEEAAKAALEGTGIDYEALQAEFAEKGELSEDSYKKLVEAKIPREMVDAYIEGQKAIAERDFAVATNAAGGEEQFNQMREWAKTGLTKPEIDAFNKAVGGSQQEMLQAVTALRSRFESAYGRQPALLGGRGATTASQGYASRAEMVADMRDPKYAKDPAFRAKVAGKINATTAF
jgi:hypothetical protein